MKQSIKKKVITFKSLILIFYILQQFILLFLSLQFCIIWKEKCSKNSTQEQASRLSCPNTWHFGLPFVLFFFFCQSSGIAANQKYLTKKKSTKVILYCALTIHLSSSVENGHLGHFIKSCSSQKLGMIILTSLCITFTSGDNRALLWETMTQCSSLTFHTQAICLQSTSGLRQRLKTRLKDPKNDKDASRSHKHNFVLLAKCQTYCSASSYVTQLNQDAQGP